MCALYLLKVLEPQSLLCSKMIVAAALNVFLYMQQCCRDHGFASALLRIISYTVSFKMQYFHIYESNMFNVLEPEDIF